MEDACLLALVFRLMSKRSAISSAKGRHWRSCQFPRQASVSATQRAALPTSPMHYGRGNEGWWACSWNCWTVVSRIARWIWRLHFKRSARLRCLIAVALTIQPFWRHFSTEMLRPPKLSIGCEPYDRPSTICKVRWLR
ncbi:hypothetical protein B0T17DRAFT_71504 [Bombardia bombarda]|uniref:Uncharacterized protein n=1 Tax=Bombardia bombarda TaxID=252184 RepID=A0AA39XLF5_9PEZI|nr:hypothetical protein B0T17DRAFT_71504 [Bombardia bombarda]